VTRSRVESLLAMSLAFAVFVLAYVLVRQPDGRVHVWWRPSAGGLIETPAGAFILVDGGRDPLTLTNFLGDHLPPLQRRLDLVILTRWEERLTAAQVDALGRYPPHEVWYPAQTGNTAAQAPWWDTLPAATSRHPLRSGLTYHEDGVWITILQDEPLVLRLRAGHFALLYTPNAPSLPMGTVPFGENVTVWMTAGLPPAQTPLPPLVLLPDAADPVHRTPALLLQHPRTIFLIGDASRLLSLTSDGNRFSWQWR